MVSEDIPGTQTLRHGLQVLRSVADGNQNLAEVVKDTGLSRSKVHRILQALRNEGFLRTEGRGEYRLGPALISLGYQARNEVSLIKVAYPILEELSRVTLDTVHLGMEQDSKAFYLLKFDGERGIQIRSEVGTFRSITRTGLGRALIVDQPSQWAQLYNQEAAEMQLDTKPEAVAEFIGKMAGFAAQGWTTDIEENEPGIRCVAAPVRDSSGEVIGAISISSAAMYMGEERRLKLAEKVKEAALNISQQLGYHPAD
ncbi:DNA-binding transcriptional regulator, IclR family [Actinobaculum suis]|uniref:DNA-binding transcriptional regulator, IclR family n=1 Tax=Actinobaculum suis TaxID=1657 RepID=A0A0K9EUF0_9ACTO|nr:IclR family transcriptional regulator [Actinobaculum suis]KMY23778.1 hypothetical protein ACU19_01850 [Actinobaculum suis]MDY5153824.1 IclR family transcriptional regulator [Actinobaculum suis]OCA93265.1 hypothetical protein ACU20_01740 [Actinobaculum suis]OCA94419.1 hypothetical protein ACU21_06815 [Actinobaculum suis]SDE29705.1 DNA-binding transcriptional regulator, IclR family [Actinobaculum suis]